MKPLTVAEVDAVLPQTQCQECGYKGCLPYANAIVHKGETIDRCPPGGINTLKALAQLTQQDYQPLLKTIQEKQRSEQIAIIREDECIGCTKCIQACPVDAIMGTAKKMHTILTDQCTGCELCIPPCPVDCIDLKPIIPRDHEKKQVFADQSRQRYIRHQQRLIQQKKHHSKQYQEAKSTLSARKTYIAEAIKRTQQKKDTAS
jgi:Na+-translocating ferredoxin:NAD+ oxidoreductase subunit B